MDSATEISIVIPVFEAQDTIKRLLGRIEQTLKPIGIAFEVILVDDGSTDKSWELIETEGEAVDYISAIKFSRNYGQHNAISAGLNYAKGEWIVVMDCDLQDQPEEIPKLYMKAKKGFDVVVGQRIKRGDKKSKILFSKIFHIIFSILTGLNLEEGIGNFGIYNKKVIKGVVQFKETFKPFPIIVRTLGFKRAAIQVAHAKRLNGSSNYNNFGLIKGATNTILYYSHKPIWMFLIGGLSMVAFVLFLLVGILFVTIDISILHLIVILIILMSFVSLNVAMIGVYVSRIFIEIKNRPAYIVDQIFMKNLD